MSFADRLVHASRRSPQRWWEHGSTPRSACRSLLGYFVSILLVIQVLPSMRIGSLRSAVRFRHHSLFGAECLPSSKF
jgi:hypothetical protein